MKKVAMFGFVCAAVLSMALVACGPNEEPEPTPDDKTEQPDPTPTPEPEPEPEPAPLPNISKDVPECSIAEFTNWQTHFADSDVIGDFSGLCFNKDHTGFIGVSNYNGRLYNINFDGTREAKEFLRTGKDFEGVTLDPRTGIYYICEEGGNFIWKAEEVDGTYVASRVKWVEGAGGDGGLEGITYHDGYLYVANQSPATIYIYSLDHVGSKDKCAYSYRADFIKECFSDLWFDTTNNTIWAVDAWGSEIVNFTVWGDFIARFDVEGIVPWIEGVCIDFENNKAWFACDSSGQLFSADIVRNN